MNIAAKPTIPQKAISLAIELSILPTGMQKGSQRHVDSRRLAHRLRIDEAFTKGGAGALGGDTWKNISAFMAGAIEQGDFKTLDQFCEAWIGMKRNIAPAQAANRCIAAAVMTIQGSAFRAPTHKEIKEQCAADNLNNPKGLKISASAITGFIQSLGLGDCLSSEKRGRGN